MQVEESRRDDVIPKEVDGYLRTCCFLYFSKPCNYKKKFTTEGKIRTTKDHLKRNIVAVQEDYMYKESVEIGASAGEHKIPLREDFSSNFNYSNLI